MDKPQPNLFQGKAIAQPGEEAPGEWAYKPSYE